MGAGYYPLDYGMASKCTWNWVVQTLPEYWREEKIHPQNNLHKMQKET